MISERAPDLGFGKDPDTSVIGPEWHDRIRVAYADSNRQLVAQYFADERVLESFELPAIKPKFTMTTDQVVVHGLRLLMRIVYHIDQENRGFRQKIGNLHRENQALKDAQKRLEERVEALSQLQGTSK
jgi:FtsZ-binding cell division protein ZapB